MEQDGEMFGDVCLFHPGALDEIGDGAGSGLQGLEEGEPARFGEDAEEAGDGTELGCGKREGFFGCHITQCAYRVGSIVEPHPVVIPISIMKTISPHELHRRLAQDPDVRLLDVRTPSEHSALHVPGVLLQPLGSLDPEAFLREHGADPDSSLYVLCETGMRARNAIEAFEKAGFHNCVLVEGGTRAWADAGLPVNRGEARGLPVERQTQAVAGLMILLGALLGWQVHPAWFGLCAFVGAGLTMAGLTGFCPLALMLARMPWNTAGTRTGVAANA